MSDATKILGVETGDISEINEIDAATITEVMSVEVDFLPVPIGLIIPFNDTSIPDGWTRFSSADNKMIIGAGSSYNPGNSGGSTSLSITSQSLSTAGSHGSGTPQAIYVSKPGSHGYYAYNQQLFITAGNHSHSITTGTGTYNPLMNNIVLIKATSDFAILPPKSILLSHNGQLGSLTNVMNNNRFMRGSSSIGTTGNNTVSFSCPYSSAGIHQHQGSPGGQTTYHASRNPNDFRSDVGGHSGSANLSLTISESIRKVQLSAWSNAAAEIELLPDMIGMYESLTPPEGWVLCDGNNGSPDLRNSFVYNVPGGSETSSSSGNNTVDISGSGSENHSHSHYHQLAVSNPQVDYTDAWHGTYSWSHSHTYSVNQNKSYLPPYYALSFIMKAA